MTTKLTSVELQGGSLVDMTLPSTDSTSAIPNTAWVQSLITATTTGVLGGNGWIKFSNGLILQWGQAVGAGGGGNPVTFPIAFTTLFTVVVCALPSSSSSIFSNATNLSSTGFNMITVGTPVYQSGWVALGR